MNAEEETVHEALRPDREWIEVLADELARTRAAQARARVVALYQATVVPDTATGPKGDRSVLELVYDPKHRPTAGPELARHQAALDIRRRLLEDELARAQADEATYLAGTGTEGPAGD